MIYYRHILTINLPSSSNIVIVTSLGSVIWTLLGSDDGLIATANFSLFSSIVSLIILISNEAVVFPAKSVTLYGPDT